MCGQWGERGVFKNLEENCQRLELGPADVRRIIDQVAHWKPAVTLFGGEPLVNPGIIEMISSVKEAGLRCNMITNGILIGRMARDLVRSGIDELIVSLDGLGEVHDLMRGKPGTYQKVHHGLEQLIVEKLRVGNKHPIVNINTTIWEGNAGHIAQLVPVAGKLGVSTITFHHPIFVGREDMDRQRALLEKLYGVKNSDFEGFVRETPPQIDVERLLREKNKIEHLHDGVKAVFYPNYTEREIRRYYTNLEYTPDSYKSKCVSPWMVTYVFPNGDLRPCLSLGVTLGNVFETPIEEILQGEAAKYFRCDLKERGVFPACSRCTELYRF